MQPHAARLYARVLPARAAVSYGTRVLRGAIEGDLALVDMFVELLRSATFHDVPAYAMRKRELTR